MPVRSAGPVRLLRERGSRESAGSNPARQMPDQRPGLPSNSSLSRRKSGRGTLTRGNDQGSIQGAPPTRRMSGRSHDLCAGRPKGPAVPQNGRRLPDFPREGPDDAGRACPGSSPGSPRKAGLERLQASLFGDERDRAAAPAPPEQPKKARTAPQGA